MADKVVEILLYTLKPGTGAEFHRIMQEISVPLHRRAEIDVVTYGCSLHDPDAYCLIRSFDSLDHLKRSQDDFYGSEEWRNGPRGAIIERIAISVKSVVSLSAESVEALRG